MAGREQRIDNALQQLVYRLIAPGHGDDQGEGDGNGEDEGEEERRLDNGLQLARDILESRDSVPATAEDVNHAADLIKKRLIRQNDRPDKAAKFSNLYSRLLSKPVLSQKWAILYFMYQLADGRTERGTSTEASLVEKKLDKKTHDHDTRAGDEAFSRTGLPRLPRTEDREALVPMPRLPRTKDKEVPMPRLPHTEDTEVPRPSARESISLRSSLGRLPTGVTSEPDEPAQSEHSLAEMSPSEAQLLRDLPFTLQGLSSTTLSFTDDTSLALPAALPVPLISLLHTLAEPSLLYRNLACFVELSEGGLVAQSLKSAIGIELRAYLGLVATLEGQIRRALTQMVDHPGSKGLGNAGVTLKRCTVWTREATMGLRLLSIIVEESKGKQGGELISLIHAYSSSHGDPFVYTFAERLLAHVTKPLYAMLQHWIYNGELEDPFHEFFVEENQDLDAMDFDPRRGGATSVWEDKYRLKESMIPSIIAPDFAKKIFLIGKSLNFISYGCGDSTWVEHHSKDSSQELKYGDTATLETSIDSAYKRTMTRLIYLMDTKFKLLEHLTALKKYLLLGQGDFIALLMESLSYNLDRPANSQYRHTLTAQLEHAIRNSNAQHDSADVLRRLDARMLELSHGEIGWDVFTLEYRVDSPLDVVVTPWASKQYLKVFNFLWRVKRVEFALGSTWRRCMTGARGVLGAVGDKVDADWKSARGGVAEMIHFVSQLQHYILFEVIEAGWEGLQRAISNPDATLDTIIAAHNAYLRSITRKGLLASSSSSSQSTSSSTASPDFTIQLHELLKLMLLYKDAVDNLYSFSVAEFTRRQDLAAKIETRTAAGGWGISERDEEQARSAAASPFEKPTDRRRRERETDSPIPPLLPLSGSTTDDAGMLTSLRTRLKTLEDEFRARVNVLLGDLAYQPDVDMRFLGVVMNFNDVYQPVRRGKKKDKGREGAGHGDRA